MAVPSTACADSGGRSYVVPETTAREFTRSTGGSSDDLQHGATALRGAVTVERL